MKFLAPTPTPYDPLAWRTRPLDERGRQVCEAWAMQGYGAPLAVYAAYVLKVAGYVLAWAWCCSFSPTLGPLGAIDRWWLEPLAFQKAVLFSLLFEVLGFGCGSGPLTGRYLPPLGGLLSFLQPGTTKLPLFPGLPLVGGDKRTMSEVLLYLALVVSLGRAVLAPTIGFGLLVPVVVLVPVLGVLDKTIFLAARAEHYWVTTVCFAFAPSWVAGAKVVQLALWFWAGVSKLNHHFPSVVGVMTSNGPLTQLPWLRRAMYRRFPDDLRPSTLATRLGHLGTTLELGVPLAFLLTPLGTSPVVAMVLMLGLHLYITSSVPMGVPIEWNVAVVYGAFALFWAHPEVSVLSVQPWWLVGFLAVWCVGLPVLGNLRPDLVSFLLAMRYYSGNWAYSVWLIKPAAVARLERLTTTSPWIYRQLAPFYDEATAKGLIGRVMAFRMMHLHGRALPHLVPKSVDSLADYEWLDGELIAGLVLGWNFGEGHLHQEQLLQNVQRQCGFDEGELRCIFVESQPVFGRSLAWRVVDAKSGLRERGEVAVEELRAHQAWTTTPHEGGVSPLA
jgi:hypothetical protein